MSSGDDEGSGLSEARGSSILPALYSLRVADRFISDLIGVAPTWKNDVDCLTRRAYLESEFGRMAGILEAKAEQAAKRAIIPTGAPPAPPPRIGRGQVLAAGIVLVSVVVGMGLAWLATVFWWEAL